MRLSCTDADVSVVARGAHGRAIQQAGLTLVAGHERRTVQLECVETPAALPRQDIVIVAVKGLQLAAIAEPLTSLLRPDTRVVFAMNGIPWCSYSSTSDMSCPIWRKAAPHAAQLHPASSRWAVDHGFAWQMLRQLTPSGALLFGATLLTGFFNVGDFAIHGIIGPGQWRQARAHELHLGIVVQLLAGAAITHAPQVRQLQREFVDQHSGRFERLLAVLDRSGQRLDLGL